MTDESYKSWTMLRHFEPSGDAAWGMHEDAVTVVKPTENQYNSQPLGHVVGACRRVLLCQ